MDKTILIGHTGFLGSYILEKNSEVIAVGRSPLPYFLKNKYINIKGDNDFSPLSKLDFNNVIFLIGNSDHEILNGASTLALEKNVLPLYRFLHYLKSTNKIINKVITFTTMLQYDSNRMMLPVDESQARLYTKNNYIFSKYVAEMVSDFYRNIFQIIDLRISNVFGPTRLYRPDLVPSLIWKLLEKKNPSVWTKKPVRDFIFVDDVIKAVQLLLETDYSGPVNLGTGKGNSVNTVCNILEKISGLEIGDQNKIVGGHLNFAQDISLLKKLIKWAPDTSLDTGLELTFNKMNKYYKESVGPLHNYK